MVPRPGDPPGRQALLDPRGRVVDRVHLRRDGQREAPLPGGLGDRRAVQDLQAAGHAGREVLAGRRRAAGLQGQLPQVAAQELGGGGPRPGARRPGPAGRDAAVRPGGQAHGEGGAVAPLLCRHRERGEGGERWGDGGEHGCCCCCGGGAYWCRWLWARGRRCPRARCRCLMMMMTMVVVTSEREEEERNRKAGATFFDSTEKNSLLLFLLLSPPPPLLLCVLFPTPSPRSAPSGTHQIPFFYFLFIFFFRADGKKQNERREKNNKTKQNLLPFIFFFQYLSSTLVEKRKKSAIGVFLLLLLSFSFVCSGGDTEMGEWVPRAGQQM